VEIKSTDLSRGQKKKIYTKFVFIGAGGGSITIIRKKADVQKEKDTVVFLLVGSGLNAQTEVIAKHRLRFMVKL
jgi:malate dehydrogenase (quinone)